MNTNMIRKNSPANLSEIVGMEGSEMPQTSRRSAMWMMLGAGASCLGISSCGQSFPAGGIPGVSLPGGQGIPNFFGNGMKNPGLPIGTFVLLTGAIAVLENKGDRKNAEKVKILIAVLALTAVVVAYYRASQAQKDYVIKRRNYLDKQAAKLAPGHPVVAVRTSQPSGRPQKTYTAKGRQVEDGRKAVGVAGKSFAPAPKPVMLYDTRRKTLKSSTVYEVSNPKKKESVVLAGNKIPYVD